MKDTESKQKIIVIGNFEGHNAGDIIVLELVINDIHKYVKHPQIVISGRKDYRIEELEEIIQRVALQDRIGICFDTCHTWDAGYDLVHDFDGVLKHFDKVIGLDRLRAVHFNDSKNPCGSHKDRHEKIGQGYLGEEALKSIAKHPLLSGLPFILETPNDDAGYIREIHMMQEWFAQ